MDDDKAAASSGRQRKQTKDEVIAELRSKQRQLFGVVDDLEARMRVLEIAAPASIRALGWDELHDIVEKDRQQEFEVLEEWSHLGEVLKPGRLISRAQYHHLFDFVRDGLKLGMPINGGQLGLAAEESRRRAEIRSNLARAELAAEAEAGEDAAQ